MRAWVPRYLNAHAYGTAESFQIVGRLFRSQLVRLNRKRHSPAVQGLPLAEDRRLHSPAPMGSPETPSQVNSQASGSQDGQDTGGRLSRSSLPEPSVSSSQSILDQQKAVPGQSLTSPVSQSPLGHRWPFAFSLRPEAGSQTDSAKCDCQSCSFPNFLSSTQELSPAAATDGTTETNNKRYHGSWQCSIDAESNR